MLPENLAKRLDEIEQRYLEVQSQLQDPAVNSRPDSLRDLGKQAAELGEIVNAYREWKKALAEAASAGELLSGESDPEMRREAELEIERQESLAGKLEEQLREHLVPKDPADDKDVIVEIKAGEGGEESALFAGELFQMYQRYAERRRWKSEVLSLDPSDLGGIKEVRFAVKGKGAFSRLKHEAGVHRVQRVPETESQGRIHTSAVGVLVFPEAEEVDVKIDPQELRIDVFRAGGPGGQSVNTTDSAVRITHVPTGMVVSCQDERSQMQNRDKAMRILRARLFQVEVEKQQQESSAARRAQVRTVDRSEKVRTYNYPQNRVTDHRVGISVHNLQGVLNGEHLDQFVEALMAKERSERLQVLGDGKGS